MPGSFGRVHLNARIPGGLSPQHLGLWRVVRQNRYERRGNETRTRDVRGERGWGGDRRRMDGTMGEEVGGTGGSGDQAWTMGTGQTMGGEGRLEERFGERERG